MAEYIKREEVYQYLDNEVEWNVNQDRLYTLEVISDFPAANVAEVRYGRWIPEICESISKRNRLIEYKVYSCSLCGRSNGRVKKKYCPNCGALMKEDEHETVQ